MPEEFSGENISEVVVKTSDEYDTNKSTVLDNIADFQKESAHFSDEIEALDSLEKETRRHYISKYATTSAGDDGTSAMQLWDSKNSASNLARGELLDRLFDIKDRPYEYRVDVKTDIGVSSFYLGLKTIKEVDADYRIYDFNTQPYKSYLRYKSSDNNGDSPVLLRREFEIEKRKFVNYTDIWRSEDANSTLLGNGMIDPVLVHLLELQRRNSDLTNIIITIRDDQDEIVEMSRTQNLIVQGCAGSGKTVILMHRLSNLQSNDVYFNSNNTLLLIPSNQYSAYINTITTRLAINKVRQTTVEKYYNDLLTIIDKSLALDDKTPLKTDYSAGVEVVKYVYSDEFIKDFDDNYQNYLIDRSVLITSLINMGKKTGMPINENALNDSWDSYKFYNQIKNIRKNAESRHLPEKIVEVLKKIEKAVTTEKTYKDVFKDTIMTKFPELSKRSLYGIRRFDLYARMLFCMKYYDGLTDYNLKKYELICVDEAQDLAPNEYRLIKNLNGGTANFNLFGDVKQCLTPERGITNWNDLYTIIPAFIERNLNKNYRNRDSIIDYCNTKIFEDKFYAPNMEKIGLAGGKVEEITIDSLNDEIKSNPCPENKRWAILIPRMMEKESIKALIKSKQLSTNEIDPGIISIMYVDEVKGFEFEKAFIFNDGMMENELYIAATRALEQLVIVSI